jgi:sugar porter (SP) family MFS transporter
MKPFERDFGYTNANETTVSSLAVSLQQLGAFVACFAIWPFTHHYGRRISIGVCALVFCIGAAIQTAPTHSRPAFYVGRVVAGLGLGGSSVVVPMFSSEMTPKQIRGQVGSFYQLMYTLGIFTSYWIDWGVANDIPKSASRMWMIPVGLQILWAGLLGLGMFTLKESARWLTAKERHDEAWASLTWIRADSGPAVQQEMEEIRYGVEFEAHAREGFKLTEMVQGDNLRRTLTAAAVFTAQQATGATAFAYYGPQYFKLLVGSKGNNDLLLTAIFGAIKVAACGLFVLFVADNVGRRAILTGGALFMAACQISTAAVVKTHPARGDGTVTSAGIATIALIYLFVIAYNFSWGMS